MRAGACMPNHIATLGLRKKKKKEASTGENFKVKTGTRNKVY